MFVHNYVKFACVIMRVVLMLLFVYPLVKCISRDIANGRKQASIRFLGCVGYGLVILELLKVKDEKEE